MTSISYDSVPYPVADKFAEAHNRFWRRLARPGAWFTAAQRVAIAAEVRQARDCGLCRERKDALSPNYVAGKHDTNSDLSDVTVEVIHRVTTDPGRLSKTWFDGLLEQGLSEEQYVEIIGTVVSVVNIDDFCLALGLDPTPLPQPEEGEPSHYRPAGAALTNSWVSTLDEKAARGDESDLYAGMPRAGNVIKALSLVPDEARTLLDFTGVHYVPMSDAMNVKRAHGGLDRLQIELIASRVSALNGCFY